MPRGVQRTLTSCSIEFAHDVEHVLNMFKSSKNETNHERIVISTNFQIILNIFKTVQNSREIMAKMTAQTACAKQVRLEMSSDSARHILQRSGLDTRKMSIGESIGREEQFCRSLHETSGRTENAVGCEETWFSNPRRYEW